MKKPKRGRPPLAAGQHRSGQLHLLMPPEERQHLAAMAKRNARSASDEALLRLRASFQNEPVWEDAIQLGLNNPRTAVRVLVENGWIQSHDQRYGGSGTVLSAPGTSPPGPFIEGEETPSVVVVADENVEKALQGIFVTYGIPVVERAPLRQAVFEALTKRAPKKKGGKWKGEKEREEDAA